MSISQFEGFHYLCCCFLMSFDNNYCFSCFLAVFLLSYALLDCNVHQHQAATNNNFHY